MTSSPAPTPAALADSSGFAVCANCLSSDKWAASVKEGTLAAVWELKLVCKCGGWLLYRAATVIHISQSGV